MTNHPKLRQEIAAKVSETVSRSDVAGDQTSVAPITAAVMDEVGPRMDQLTNQQPIWQSQTFWGLVVLIATRELALRGYAVPEEFHGPILDLTISYGPYAAAALIAWGRFIAKKPLFSGWFSRQ